MRYLGGKARLAKHLVPVMDVPADAVYVEPFVGGANVMAAQSHVTSRIGADAHPYLIAFHAAVRDGWTPDPTTATRETYETARSNPGEFPDYLVGYLGFGSSMHGDFFRCFIGTPRNKHQTDHVSYAESARNVAVKVRPRIQGVEFVCADYRTLMIPDGAYVYCDPPYRGTLGYSTGDFDSDEFWTWAYELSRRCVVFVSELSAPEGWRTVWSQERKRMGSGSARRTTTECLFRRDPSDFTASARRVHSPSSISTGRKCKHAWWLNYHRKIRPPEAMWADVRDGKVDPRGGVRSRALGKAVHALHETHAEHGADAIPTDAWDDLPGAVLQTMLPHLPAGGSLRKEQIERKFVLEQDGVGFKGLIDVDDAHGVTDLKTTSDIRKYALLPDGVARSIHQPERSLKNDLQACTYALERARRSRPPAPHTRMKWVYGETGRSRRSLPVVQIIPTAHARAVVKSAAAFGRMLESTIHPDGTGATPNTLACDDYGGCWYRAEGHCSAQRHWGGVINKRIKEEQDMASKPTLPFNQLRDRVNAANGKPGAGAAPAPAKAAAPKGKPALPGRRVAPAPDPEPEETEADEAEADEAPAPAPAARKALPGRKPAPAPEPEADEAEADDGDAALSLLEKFEELFLMHSKAIRAAVKHALGK